MVSALAALSLSARCGGPPGGEPPRGVASAREVPTARASTLASTSPSDSESDPASLAPPAPALGVEHLQPRWRASKQLLASLADGKLVLGSLTTPTRLEIVDGATGAVIAPIAAPDPSAGIVELFAAGSRLVASQRGTLYGIDASSGATSWRTSIGSLVQVPWPEQPSSSFVLATSGDDWVGVDPTTGETRWNTPQGERGRVWLSGSRFYVERPGRLDAYRASDGARAWTFDADPSKRWLFASDARVVVAQSSDGQIRAIDAATGTVRELAGRFSFKGKSVHRAASMFGDAIVFWGLFDEGTTAVSLETGAVRWHDEADIEDLVATDDAVFVRTTGGLLRGLDATGRTRVRVEVGHTVDPGLRPLRGLPGGPGLALVDRAGGHAVLYVLARKAWASADPAPATETAGKARIVGTVRVNGALAPHLTIVVNEHKTRTDAVGRFSIEVTVPGKYTVHPAWDELPPPPQAKTAAPGCCVGVEGTSSIAVEPTAGARAQADLDMRTICHGCRP